MKLRKQPHSAYLKGATAVALQARGVAPLHLLFLTRGVKDSSWWLKLGAQHPRVNTQDPVVTHSLNPLMCANHAINSRIADQVVRVASVPKARESSDRRSRVH
jgi:hypothetical protein